MLLGPAGEKFERCNFIICLIGIEFCLFVLVYLDEINECNIEFVSVPLMDVVMIFGGDGVKVLLFHFVI